MASPHLRPGKIRPDTLVPLAVLAVLGLAIVLALRTQWAKPAVSGDPLPIRLAGIRPDCTDELRDATGKLVGERFYDLSGDQTWGTNRLRRDFIFEWVDTNAHFLSPMFELIPAGRAELRQFHALTVLPRPQGGLALVAEANVPPWREQRLLWWRRRIPIQQADIRLWFFLNQPGPALGQFDGPFQTGRPVVLAGSRTTLTPGTNWIQHTLLGAEFRLTSATGLPGYPFPVIAVEASGQRHPVQRLRSQGGAGSWAYDFRVPKVPMESVATIRIERPRQKLFRNLQVRFAGQPIRTHADYRDKVLAALERSDDPARIRALHFRNAAEAIHVIDLVRGSGAREAWKALQYPTQPFRREDYTPVHIVALPARTQDRLRRAAWTWSQTSGLRAEGIGLGLFGHWPELVAPALDVLTDPWRHGDAEAAQALSQAGAWLNEAQLQRLKSLLLQPRPWTDIERLVLCFRDHPHPSAGEALRELARDERPWLWWPAVRLLPHASMDSNAPPPSWLQQRLLLVQNQNPIRYGGGSVTVSEADQDAAYRALPDWWTAELHRRNGEAFFALYPLLVERTDRARAAVALVRYLSDAFLAGDEEARTGSDWISVKVLQQLNQWQGTRWGRWGSDPQIEPELPVPLAEWRHAAGEMLRWSATNPASASPPSPHLQ